MFLNLLSLKKSKKTYRSQVFISLTIAGKTHMYMSPFPDPNVDAEKLKKFFPTYHRTKPLASKPETNNSQVKYVDINRAKSSTEALETKKNISI